MKNLLTKNRKFIEQDIIELETRCSAIIQKNLPPKFKDPGSFTIPITIGDLWVGRELPFMKTTRAIIDVGDCEFKLTVQDEVIIFNVFEATTHPNDKGACF
uniref:Uncharacterized protein n=1 Tax=Cajanus cajan TaxID=3821 RepID=A0A151S7S8_CAJCA|nr:hypothetical protein KK1_027331 [Cajanus cajan]